MIVCENVHKYYPLGHGQKHVLKGLSFQIERGERIGLLGRNGAGKSTLIKLLGGVEYPSSGRITRSMSLSWPLGFGGGFQGGLTGFDNARFISRIYGQDYDAIRGFVEDFTELGVQLKAPVKTYSSGMRARLAFALSLVIEFDCYLIDEILLVGDQDFQRKCYHELFEKRADRALILASHSPDTVRAYCSKALIIHNGAGTFHDDLPRALELYDAL
jgi:capsular polysaccharide transport system ATP-binding protein